MEIWSIMAGLSEIFRHCQEGNDKTIQIFSLIKSLDCFALLAMTVRSGFYSSRCAGFHQLVDDRVHQRLERGINDVGRYPDRCPALAPFVRTFDQNPRHRLGAAIEDAHA